MRRRNIRQAATNHRSETVLLASADPGRRELLCRSIGNSYPVLLADSFQHAMRLARSARPSVVCIDCVHYSQDGSTRAMAQKLHHLAARLGIPLVIIGTGPNDPCAARFGDCHVCAVRASCPAGPNGIPSVSALRSSIEEACSATMQRPPVIQQESQTQRRWIRETHWR